MHATIGFNNKRLKLDTNGVAYFIVLSNFFRISNRRGTINNLSILTSKVPVLS